MMLAIKPPSWIFRLRWSLIHEITRNTTRNEYIVPKLVKMKLLVVFPCKLIPKFFNIEIFM